jgi:proline dehydrogenase
MLTGKKSLTSMKAKAALKWALNKFINKTGEPVIRSIHRAMQVMGKTICDGRNIKEGSKRSAKKRLQRLSLFLCMLGRSGF